MYYQKSHKASDSNPIIKAFYSLGLITLVSLFFTLCFGVFYSFYPETKGTVIYREEQYMPHYHRGIRVSYKFDYIYHYYCTIEKTGAQVWFREISNDHIPDYQVGDTVMLACPRHCENGEYVDTSKHALTTFKLVIFSTLLALSGVVLMYERPGEAFENPARSTQAFRCAKSSKELWRSLKLTQQLLVCVIYLVWDIGIIVFSNYWLNLYAAALALLVLGITMCFWLKRRGLLIIQDIELYWDFPSPEKGHLP